MFERFTVVPAIDLKGGKVVRLLRGDPTQATVYGDDPAAVARGFEGQGAELIHVVDLDGAIAGEPRNFDAVQAIRDAVRCEIDVSGGLRTIESIRAAFAGGVSRVSIGSAAFLNPSLLRTACREFPRRVFGSLDSREGKLAVKGWAETSALPIAEAASRFLSAGVETVILTDISRDGAEQGADAQMFSSIARQTGLQVIASGGVASLDDIRELSSYFGDGVVGAICGRALYEGRFTLAQAIAAAS